ncbi:ATP-binding protein [Robiginitomaculum antarcticum]|uniref:ATP-binding protein n=1 Tax=Robiginitomaculum antarcticum TaxID=437507 RepID=UPI0003649B3B|nr:ATP-binding protein [Robiginitomaculum antarcticum]
MLGLKQHMPKSLFGRALAIIIVPIAIMQIVVAYIFFDAHWQTVTASLSDGIASEIALAVQLYSEEPGQDRAQEIDVLLRRDMRLAVELRPGESLPPKTRNAFFSNLDRTLRRALAETIDEPFWFDTTRYPEHIDIRVAVDEGVLYFIAPRDRVFAATGFIFIFWMIMATLLLSLVSILFILNQARPIMRLAKAAEAFGKGRDIGSFKPTGASEVRQASQAFLDMRDRILRHIEQRTHFLAGVSHDLRTPLTRLRLQFAMMDKTDDTRAALADLADMEAMLDGYLDFAQGLAGEEVERTDVTALVSGLCETSGVDICDVAPDLFAHIRPGAVRRALSNLIENAKTYGKNVHVTAAMSAERWLDITIDDDGPGIAEADMDQAFAPFVRLDTARGQNVKGVGLGLSIAKDTAQFHGGELHLSRSPLGGLRATLCLPA